MQQYFPTFTVTPHGIQMNGMPLTKSISQLSPHTQRSIERAEELLAKVTPEDWDNQTPHTINHIPLLAQAKLMAALASPQPYPAFANLQNGYTLAKAQGLLMKGISPHTLLSVCGLLRKEYNDQGEVAFDFADRLTNGKTLLVGEGNFSFALSLAEMVLVIPGHITATTFEPIADLTPDAVENADTLRSLGVRILNGVDATDLAGKFGTAKFDTIIFQFPHTGNRDGIEGRTSSFILVRDFLSSAKTQLTRDGIVVISAVDSPYYQGVFHFDEAADAAGFLPPKVYSFDPSNFDGYEHTMTNENSSVLENYNAFNTFMFLPK